MFPTPVKSVSEITTHISRLLEADSDLQSVWVSGEISNMRVYSSGHWYFTLKDSRSQLKCVMWKSTAARQTVTPRDGDAVEVRGRIGVYETSGEYQLYADRIRPVGMGDLYLRFEELKQQLEAEGLFDAERKRPIPMFPRRIGVVTSPDAAAFQDVQNVLRRRLPLAEVILSPTQVQGGEAPPQIVRALQRLNAYAGVDVILMCRGGGSIEDLWCFNDERVARAVAASAIPVVSGVGHETDFTIVDFVADTRAPTPSAAAEVISARSADLLRAEVTAAQHLLQAATLSAIESLRGQVQDTYRIMTYNTPTAFIRQMRQHLDSIGERLTARQTTRVSLLRERLHGREAALHTADPRAILRRGYAMVRRSDTDTPVTSQAHAKPGEGITIQLHDGELVARVEDKDSHEHYSRTLF